MAIHFFSSLNFVCCCLPPFNICLRVNILRQAMYYKAENYIKAIWASKKRIKHKNIQRE